MRAESVRDGLFDSGAAMLGEAQGGEARFSVSFAYSIEWTAVAEDGHVMKGQVPFTVAD